MGDKLNQLVEMATIKLDQIAAERNTEGATETLEEYFKLAGPVFGGGIFLARGVTALRSGNRRKGLVLVALSVRDLYKGFGIYQEQKKVHGEQAVEKATADAIERLMAKPSTDPAFEFFGNRGNGKDEDKSA